jgi:hypothetical protein
MAGLVATAAGPAAQSLHMHRGRRLDFIDRDSWATFGGGGDYDDAEWIRGYTRQFVHASTGDIASEAFDLLEDRGVWEAVERVAKDLRRFGEVDFELVQAAVNGG